MGARPNLDMDALRSFLFGVELGSFAKAADRVGRSASAVSEQMTRLEQQVGKPLLRKQGRGLTPTAAGETLLGYARRLLDLNDEAVATLRGADVEGWVRLGLPQDFAERWLPQVLGRFTRQHPRVRVEVRAERSRELIDRVDTGQLDLALTWGEPRGAHAELLADLPICWIGPAQGDLNWSPGETLPLIAFEPPCYFRSAGVAALDAAGIPWRLAFTTPSLTGLWAAVAAGLGISLRTHAGLPDNVRALGPDELVLPGLPRIALSLFAADAAPSPAVAMLGLISRETLSETLRPFQLRSFDEVRMEDGRHERRADFTRRGQAAAAP